MKKIVCVLLAVVLMCGALAGCGSVEENIVGAWEAKLTITDLNFSTWEFYADGVAFQTIYNDMLQEDVAHVIRLRYEVEDDLITVYVKLSDENKELFKDFIVGEDEMVVDVFKMNWRRDEMLQVSESTGMVPLVLEKIS